MAGRLVDSKFAAITGASATGYITVASTTGFYKTAKVYLTDSGGTNHQHAVITEIASATSIGIRFITAAADTIGQGVGFGRSNVAAPIDFNGGRIDQEQQFIYNPNDQPLA